MGNDLDFAAELRRLRRHRGFSQAVLARRAQVSERAVRYWEAGATFPGQWELQSVLTILAPEPGERARLISILPNRRGTQLARQEMAEAGETLGAPPALGDLLRAMRLRRGLTQSRVADRMRVTRSTVLRWESTRSLPSGGNLERLCVLYDAHVEEHRVLQSRRLQNALGESAPASLSLDGYEEKVARLSEAVHWPDNPLIDLQALLLKRELWALAVQSEDALHLLVTVQVRHGLYLIEQSRKKEATSCLKHALTLFHGRRANREIWRELINVAAPYIGSRSENENGLRVTQKWLPLFPDTLQAPLWCDIALYAAVAGQHDYAAYSLKQAQKLLPLSFNAAYRSEDYFPISQAKTLIRAKRPWEALDWLARLPATSESAGMQVSQQLFMVEALIDAKETAQAQRHLDAVRRHFEQYPQPLYMPKFNQLAARV